jgi:glutaredoxin-related protein
VLAAAREQLAPQCGFSNNAVNILRALDVKFETFDVLADPDIRQVTPKRDSHVTKLKLVLATASVMRDALRSEVAYA